MGTLEENLEEEANKKGLTGEEKDRYIGGTINKIKKEHPYFRKVGEKKEPMTAAKRYEITGEEGHYNLIDMQEKQVILKNTSWKNVSEKRRELQDKIIEDRDKK